MKIVDKKGLLWMTPPFLYARFGDCRPYGTLYISRGLSPDSTDEAPVLQVESLLMLPQDPLNEGLLMVTGPMKRDSTINAEVQGLCKTTDLIFGDPPEQRYAVYSKEDFRNLVSRLAGILERYEEI